MRDVPPAQAPSTADFRKRMGLFPTGVCVVAVEAEESATAAMTINSFVSISLDPMLVCWSLHNSSSQFDLFAQAERFSVSILADGQTELALRYAARGSTMLNSEDFSHGTSGLPVVAGALGYFECHQWSTHPGGDHTMILGEVTGLNPEQGGGETRRPLGFFNGQFCSIDR